MKNLVLSLVFFSTTSLFATQDKLIRSEVSRKDRWTGSFNGCTQNATQAEKDKYQQSLVLLCACMATDLINTCAPKDTTKTSEVMACMEKLDLKKAIEKAEKCVNNVELVIK